MSTSDSSTPAKRPASVLDPSTQPSDDAGDRPLPASPAPHANYPVAAPIDAGEDVCPRCFRIHPGGLVECMIPGSWPKAFPALYGGDCACGATWGCQRIIGSKELLGGDAEQASMVLKVPDVGVMHVDCAIKMLEDISGPVESYADSRARLLQMMYDKHVMPGIQHGVLDLFDLEKPPDDGGDRFGATITNSVPGAVKSGEQAILHRHHGPLLTLGLVFNSAAAKGLRKGGALNSHTYNSYGGSQLVRHNNDNLYHWRYLSSQKSLHAPFTAAENPDATRLSLLENGNKYDALLNHLLPAKRSASHDSVSVVFKGMASYIVNVYQFAVHEGFGIDGAATPQYPDGLPTMMNLGELKKLSDAENLVPKFLDVHLSALSPAEVRELKSLCGPTKDKWIQFALCSVSFLHDASLATAKHPAWTPEVLITYPEGEAVAPMRMTFLKYAAYDGTTGMVKLPVIAFDEQITNLNYEPEIRVVSRPYRRILGDELNDLTTPKLLLQFKAYDQSEALRLAMHAPIPPTIIDFTGDTDQGINHCYKSLLDPVNAIKFQCAKRGLRIYNRTKYQSVRCCEPIAQFAAVKLRDRRTALGLPQSDKPNMVAAIADKAGDVLFDKTFKTAPLADYIGRAIAFICRRNAPELIQTSSLLVRLGLAHQVIRNSTTVTPFRRFAKLVAMLKKQKIGASQVTPQTVEQVLDALNFYAVPKHQEDDVAGLRVIIARYWPTAEAQSQTSFLGFQKTIESHFSDDACAFIDLLSAHTSKGNTYFAVYIVQENLFPLEQSVKEGGGSLLQEPNVEYVAYTRAEHYLIFLRNVDAGKTLSAVYLDEDEA